MFTFLLLRAAQAACIIFGIYLLRLLLFLGRCAYCRYSLYPSDKTPGPPSAATILGHFFALGGDKGPWNIAAWSEEHGPLFKLQIFDRVVYVLSDPATISRLARRTGASPSMVKPREMYAALDSALKPAMPSILTSDDNAYWRAVRSGAAPCFSNTNIKKVLPLVLEKTGKVAARIAALAADSGKVGRGAEFDVADGAKRITSDVMGNLLFGRDLGGTEWQPSPYLDVFYPVLMAQAGLISNPLHLLQVWRPEVRHQRRSLAAHNAIMTQMVADVMQHPPPDHTIAAHLLSVRDPDTGAPLVLNQLKAEIATFMAAGFETTSHAITWSLALLAAYPDVQEQLLHELQGLGLAAAAPGEAARDIDASDLGRLPYMQAVVKEVLRLCPPAPWGGTRMVADTPQDICGYSLPKGAVVMIVLLAVSLSSRNYGPVALAFKPERWLAAPSAASTAADTPAGAQEQEHGQGAAAPASSDSTSPAAGSGPGSSPGSSRSAPDPMSFLAGSRDCIGQSLAKLELQVVLATLLGRFRVLPGERLEEELRVAEKTGRQPAEALHALAAARVTLQPAEGRMMLRLEPR